MKTNLIPTAARSARWPSIAILSALLLASVGCRAAPAEQTIDECWVDHDHPAMASCVADRAAAARTRLAAIERKTRAAIDASSESPQYIGMARSAFVKSTKSYAAYRKDQCSLRSALASIGNAASEVGLACEAALDTMQADQLEASM